MKHTPHVTNKVQQLHGEGAGSFVGPHDLFGHAGVEADLFHDAPGPVASLGKATV